MIEDADTLSTTLQNETYTNNQSDNKDFLKIKYSPGSVYELMDNLEILTRSRIATREYDDIDINGSYENHNKEDWYSKLIRKNDNNFKKSSISYNKYVNTFNI